MAAAVAVLVGVGEQEAFELLLVVAFAFYATAYLALFAIPRIGAKKNWREGRVCLLRAGSGFGFRDDSPLYRPFHLPNRRRAEQLGISGEDRRRNHRRKSSGGPDL